jgi:hypothetical protein
MAHVHWESHRTVFPRRPFPRDVGNVSGIDNSLAVPKRKPHCQKLGNGKSPYLLTEVFDWMWLLLRERLLARVSGLFGVLATLLACVWLYGVIACIDRRDRCRASAFADRSADYKIAALQPGARGSGHSAGRCHDTDRGQPAGKHGAGASGDPDQSGEGSSKRIRFSFPSAKCRPGDSTENPPG